MGARNKFFITGSVSAWLRTSPLIARSGEGTGAEDRPMRVGARKGSLLPVLSVPGSEHLS